MSFSLPQSVSNINAEHHGIIGHNSEVKSDAATDVDAVNGINVDGQSDAVDGVSVAQLHETDDGVGQEVVGRRHHDRLELADHTRRYPTQHDRPADAVDDTATETDATIASRQLSRSTRTVQLSP